MSVFRPKMNAHEETPLLMCEAELSYHFTKLFVTDGISKKNKYNLL